jgi:hypothetical protein
MNIPQQETPERGFQSFPVARRTSNSEAVFSHKTWAFRRISKNFGVYVDCGVARLPACPHCGGRLAGDAKVYLDRLPVGGFAGGLLMRVNNQGPPQLAREYPGQGAFDEQEILPQC